MSKVQNPSTNFTAGDFAVGKDLYEDIRRLTAEFNGNINAENLASPAVANQHFATNSIDANNLAANCITDAKMELTDPNDGMLVWTNKYLLERFC
jgi:hypothetical protein